MDVREIIDNPILSLPQLPKLPTAPSPLPKLPFVPTLLLSNLVLLHALNLNNEHRNWPPFDATRGPLSYFGRVACF